MAVMSGPNDWMQFYQQNFATQAPSPPGLSAPAVNLLTPADSTVLSNMTTTSPNMNRDSNPDRLSAEGSVSRPARRRPRASRRTPVTTMSTDAANFRAMVQHFTGAPSTTSAPEASRGGMNVEFGLGAARSGEVAPSGSFQQHLQQQQFHQNQLLYGMVNNDPRFGGSYIRSGPGMDESQDHHRDGSSSNDRSNNNTYNMF